MNRILSSALALVCSATICCSAAVGDWHHYPAFAMPTTDVVRTPRGMTYYVAGGNLFSYNSSTDESRSYSLSGQLTDTDITRIFYNPLQDYLLVAYASGNIDLLYDEGERTVNISDIADADVNGSKRVNDVEFAPGRAYIATDFGLVEYDDQRHLVVQSGVYNKPIGQVEVVDGYMLIHHESAIYSIRCGERFNSIDRFTQMHGVGNIYEMLGLGNHAMVVRRINNPNFYLYVYTYNDDFTEIVTRQRVGTFTAGGPLIVDSDSTFYFSSDSALYRLDRQSFEASRAADLPAPFADGEAITLGRGLGDVWAASHQGLTSYDLSAAQPAVTMQPFRPEGMTVAKVAYLTPDPLNGGFLANNLGPSVYRAASNRDDGYQVVQQTTRISSDGMTMTDLAVYDYESANPKPTRPNQLKLGLDMPLAPVAVTPHPTDPSTYYLSTGNDGLLRITDGKVAGVYNTENSPMSASYGCRVYAAEFDPQGNLWVAHTRRRETDATCLNMLPAAKVALPTSEVTAADWVKIPVAGFYDADGMGGKDLRMLISPSSGMLFAFGERSASGFLALDTRRTWGDLSDDRYHVWTSFTDQDGKPFSPDRFTSICEDSRGRVWVGSTQGIIEITNPANAADPSMTVNRLKVPRNDGTNSADYLLDADLIYDISEDNSGRKWIATEVSGLYLVSENGQEIIKHFTSDNSLLPTNAINAVYADRTTNTVWVGTNEGLFSYTSDSSPAMPSYDDVLVYPNPVKPDFTGEVTISGLMEGTLLKIADSAGNVVVQLRSEGGMARWNCENQAGRRVPTGVYYVFMSSGSGVDGGSTSGAVAKFMVVN